jgi:hypothetical protein
MSMVPTGGALADGTQRGPAASVSLVNPGKRASPDIRSDAAYDFEQITVMVGEDVKV